MASIQFGIDGEVVSEDYSQPIGDPSKQETYTDEQLLAAAAVADTTDSREQANLFKIRDEILDLEAKATAVDFYDSENKPHYKYSADERARFAAAAEGKRATQLLQLQISNRTIGARHLEQVAEQQSLQAQADRHDEIRRLAIAEVEKRQVDQMATMMMKQHRSLNIG